MNEDAAQENSRDRQARDTKARLIAAALTLFAQNGVGSTSIKDIAWEAGVAQGLSYHYFGLIAVRSLAEPGSDESMAALKNKSVMLYIAG